MGLWLTVFFFNRLYLGCIKLNRTQISLSLMLIMLVPNPNDGNTYGNVLRVDWGGRSS